jgi:hypothetical protein
MPKTHPTYDSGFRQEAVNLLISKRHIKHPLDGALVKVS